eukprot:322280-Prymnesium_polylepis.1
MSPISVMGHLNPPVIEVKAADPVATLSKIRSLHVTPPTGCGTPQVDFISPFHILSHPAALASCGSSPGHCGSFASCIDAPISPIMQLTTPKCHCEGLKKPIASNYYPIAVTPFFLGCTTPREGAGVGIAALDVYEVVLSLTKPATASRTLTLRMAGTAERNSTWAIDPASVPGWLQLDRLSGDYTSQSNEAPIVQVTATTSGYLERPEGYEESIKLTVFSDTVKFFQVPVLLKLSALDDASTSTWGAIAAPETEGAARASCVGVPLPSSAATVDQEFRVPFTACDLDALPVAHALPSATDPRSFTATVLHDGVTHTAAVLPDSYGLYRVIVASSRLTNLGAYVIQLHLATEAFGGGNFPFTAACPQGQVPDEADITCGCPRGSVLRDGVCRPCPAGYSAAVGEVECRRCAEGYFNPAISSNATSGSANVSAAANVRCASCETLGDGQAAYCPWDATIETVRTRPNYWRLTAQTDEVIKCLDTWSWPEVTPCAGGTFQNCTGGHEGVECKICSKDMHTVGDNGMCEQCPDGSIPAIMLFVSLVMVVIQVYLVY